MAARRYELTDTQWERIKDMIPRAKTDDYIHISEGAMVVRLMDSIFRSSNTSSLVEV